MVHVLALDAYHSGSHRTVLDEWQQYSRHQLTLMTLPGRHWKWRMHHAAVTFAEMAADCEADLVWCTDMLDLACWRGLAPRQLRDLPHILYMHENQFIYPLQDGQQPDYHYAFTNLSSAYAADVIAWNSAWHRDVFIDGMHQHMRRMPDYPLDVKLLAEKSTVLYPGFQSPAPLTQRTANTLPHLLWAARWEWEKGPDIFFNALAKLGEDVPFTLSVLGGDPAQGDALFERAAQCWQHRIKQWGYLDSRKDYFNVLREADIAVSTARHEFFGLAMVEACAAGCLPVLPQQLSYPEVFAHVPETVFYAGDSDALAASLHQVLRGWQHDENRRLRLQQSMQRYTWPQLIGVWDDAVDDLLA